MKPKTLILMGVAIACGLIASYMTSKLITEQSKKVWVAKATKEMPQWYPVKDPMKDFEAIEIDQKDAPKGYIRGEFFKQEILDANPKLMDELNKLKNRQLLKQLHKDDILTVEVLQATERAGLEGVLPQGMRAFAVKATLDSAVAGFVLPGSHVDLIHTVKDGKDTFSKIILQNVLVRAVEAQLVRPDDKAVIAPTTVTLEVTPDQTMILTKAVSTGSIAFSLRAFGDETKYEEAKADPAPPPPPPPPPAPTTTDAVTEEPGGKVKEAPVKKTSQIVVVNGEKWTGFRYTKDENGRWVSEPLYPGSSATEPVKPAPKTETPPSEPKTETPPPEVKDATN